MDSSFPCKISFEGFVVMRVCDDFSNLINALPSNLEADLALNSSGKKSNSDILINKNNNCISFSKKEENLDMELMLKMKDKNKKEMKKENDKK